MREVPVSNLPIELAKLLKYAGLAESGGQAKHLITESQVRVNDKPVTQKSHKIQAEDIIEAAGQKIIIKPA